MKGMMSSLCEYDKAVKNHLKAPGATLTEVFSQMIKNLNEKAICEKLSGN